MWTEPRYHFLSASIIDHIIDLHKKDKSIAYAYFFFDGRDKQEDFQLYSKLIRSFIDQLSVQCDGGLAILSKLYGDGRSQPSTDSRRDTLHVILNRLASVYLIIDSLNECTERGKVLEWICQIADLKMDNLHLVVTSRPELNIRHSFSVDIHHHNSVDVEIYIVWALTDSKWEKW